MFGWFKKLEESFSEKYTFNKVAIIFYAGLSFLFGACVLLHHYGYF